MTEPPRVLLVHGAFARGSSWSAVVEDPQAKSHDITVPPATAPARAGRRDVSPLIGWQSS